MSYPLQGVTMSFGNAPPASTGDKDKPSMDDDAGKTKITTAVVPLYKTYTKYKMAAIEFCCDVAGLARIKPRRKILKCLLVGLLA